MSSPPIGLLCKHCGEKERFFELQPNTWYCESCTSKVTVQQPEPKKEEAGGGEPDANGVDGRPATPNGTSNSAGPATSKLDDTKRKLETLKLKKNNPLAVVLANQQPPPAQNAPTQPVNYPSATVGPAMLVTNGANYSSHTVSTTNLVSITPSPHGLSDRRNSDRGKLTPDLFEPQSSSSSSGPTPEDSAQPQPQASPPSKPPISKKKTGSFSSLLVSVDAMAMAAEMNSTHEQMRLDLTDKIRQEIFEQIRDDQTIVTMEMEQVRQENAVLKRDHTELKTTLEELMASFNAHLEDAKRMKTDYRVNMELMETEIRKVRSDLVAAVAQNKQLMEEKEKTKELLDQAAERENASKLKLQQTTDELTKSQNQFNLLKKHAEDKLREAAKQYSAITQDAAEKGAVLRQMQSDLQALRTRCNLAESRLRDSESACTELQSRSQTLDQALREREMQLTNLSATNSNNERQLISVKAKAEELSLVNERYKNELIQTREQSRTLLDAAAKSSSAETEVKRMTTEIEKLQADNRSLKSRLFDVMESEKKLRQQLGSSSSPTLGSSPNLGGGSDDLQAKLKQSEADLGSLREALEAKEKENKELVDICDELLKECEALKQARA